MYQVKHTSGIYWTGEVLSQKKYFGDFVQGKELHNIAGD
jgi:hypothetical protein